MRTVALVERLKDRLLTAEHALSGEADNPNNEVYAEALKLERDTIALIELYEDALERIASGMIRLQGARPIKMTTFRMSSIAKDALSKAHHTGG